jgi:hypothetical protein
MCIYIYYISLLLVCEPTCTFVFLNDLFLKRANAAHRQTPSALNFPGQPPIQHLQFWCACVCVGVGAYMCMCLCACLWLCLRCVWCRTAGPREIVAIIISSVGHRIAIYLNILANARHKAKRYICTYDFALLAIGLGYTYAYILDTSIERACIGDFLLRRLGHAQYTLVFPLALGTPATHTLPARNHPSYIQRAYRN